MEEIDRGTIKALSADTRRKILKLLSGHRATGADISRMLGLSPSTVNEHLKKLEASSLVRRIETGHKWVYYDVSEKGHALLHSNRNNGSPVQFVLVLSIGVLLFLGGAFFTLAQKLQPSAAPMMAETATAGASKAVADASRVVTAQPSSVLPVAATLVGAAIIIVMLSSYYYKKK